MRAVRAAAARHEARPTARVRAHRGRMATRSNGGRRDAEQRNAKEKAHVAVRLNTAASLPLLLLDNLRAP
jgi:hypothetical protein